MKVQQKKQVFQSSKDPMEDLISFLYSIVTKEITLWNQYFRPSNAHTWTGNSICVSRIPSVFFGCLRRLIVVYRSFEGIFKGNCIDTFLACICRTYGERWTFALGVLQVGAHLFFMWGWLEWKFSRRKIIYIFQRSIGRYRSHIGINTFFQQIHSWCGLKCILGIILLPLPVCSHHHPHHHTVTAQHSFFGETMASTNETMFNTPTEKKNGELLLKVGKKRTTSEVVISPVFESSLSTASTVSAQSSMDFFVIVISVVAVCCVKDIVVNVNNVNDKKKTRLKQWQQSCE